MGADGNNSLAQAKATGATPVDPEFEGASPNSTKYGDKTPAQPNDKPTKTGW